MDRYLLPLLLCYANGKEKIEGRTRLQKIIFLAQKDLNIQDYKFEAASYGPFSSQLSEDLDDLVEMKLLAQNKSSGFNNSIKYEYILTDKGLDLIDSLLGEDQVKILFTTLESMKQLYNKMNIRELLLDVYKKNPEYSYKSKFVF